MREKININSKALTALLMATQWNCSICSKQILWSELFTFYSKGAVHFTCFKQMVISKNNNEEANALLYALEDELKMIVAYKKYMSKVINEDAKKLMQENEKDAEKHAALLTKLIDRSILQN